MIVVFERDSRFQDFIRRLLIFVVFEEIQDFKIFKRLLMFVVFEEIEDLKILLGGY